MFFRNSKHQTWYGLEQFPSLEETAASCWRGLVIAELKTCCGNPKGGEEGVGGMYWCGSQQSYN